MQNDVLLIEKVKSGDRAAFNELYKLYYFPIRSYAELLLSKDEAEDVVQDVFLNIWLHKERLNQELSVHSYLLRSVYNAAINIIKRRKYSTEHASDYRRNINELGYQYYDPDANSVIRRLYNQDLRAQINQAIEELPPKCREVFRLSYLQDMPSKEISRQLGISLSTVENHIYTALKQLRLKLGKYKSILILLLSNFF